MSKKKSKKKKSKTGFSTASIDGTVPADKVVKSSPIITPMPTAGEKIIEFEKRLDRQLAGDTEAGPKKGRPRKLDPLNQIQQSEVDISVIGQAVQIPFDLWSVSQGVPELKITKDESILMAKPVKQLLDHYLPIFPEIAWAWISLGMVSYSIMKSRLELIAAIKNKRSSEQRTAGVEGGTPIRRGQGRPQPSAVFPSIEQIQKPEA